MKTLFDNTFNEYHQFTGGFRVEKGRKYIWVHYLTMWEGDRYLDWRLTEEQWENLPGAPWEGATEEDNMWSKCGYLSNFCEPTRKGQRIF